MPPRSPADASRTLSTRRVITDHAVTTLAILSSAAVLVPLAALLVYLLYKGASSLNLAFFTHEPVAVGEQGGGMANAIVGSGVILGLASLIGVPVGLAAGIYVAEYGRGKPLGMLIRLTADVLNGVPSIVIGIVAYMLIPLHQQHFSATAGGVALAMMMIPVVTRTTEEMLLTVPNTLREAALGLGVPKWKMISSVSVRTASQGIVTGCLLAFARVAGETAPLLFTAFGNQFWSIRLNEPIAALPLQIFVYALSPYEEWHRLAWAGALVLVLMILISVALVRIFAHRSVMKQAQP